MRTQRFLKQENILQMYRQYLLFNVLFYINWQPTLSRTCLYKFFLYFHENNALFTLFFVCFWHYTAPQWARTSSFTRCLDHTQRRTTAGRTPLDEWSARRRDLYLTTHNTHNRQTSFPRNSSRWVAADPHLRRRGHWDKPVYSIKIFIHTLYITSIYKLMYFYDTE